LHVAQTQQRSGPVTTKLLDDIASNCFEFETMKVLRGEVSVENSTSFGVLFASRLFEKTKIAIKMERKSFII
jgi:hypothetical protein